MAAQGPRRASGALSASDLLLGGAPVVMKPGHATVKCDIIGQLPRELKHLNFKGAGLSTWAIGGQN